MSRASSLGVGENLSSDNAIYVPMIARQLLSRSYRIGVGWAMPRSGS